MKNKEEKPYLNVVASEPKKRKRKQNKFVKYIN